MNAGRLKQHVAGIGRKERQHRCGRKSRVLPGAAYGNGRKLNLQYRIAQIRMNRLDEETDPPLPVRPLVYFRFVGKRDLRASCGQLFQLGALRYIAVRIDGKDF